MQRILITGANRGLGLEFTRQYLERGAHVFACARDPQQADALHALAGQYPDRLTGVALDVSDIASITAAAAAVADQTDALDTIINNAGMNIPGEEQRVGNIDPERMLQVLRVNSVGPLLVAQAFRALLARGETPRLVNITSGLGSIGRDDSGQVIYSASKAALNMVTQRLSKDSVFNGVIVMVLDPGWVKTDMGGPGAQLEIDDAIAQNIAVIEGLTSAGNGTYYAYNGRKVPW